MRASREEDLFTGLTLKNDPMMSVDSAFGAWCGSFLFFLQNQKLAAVYTRHTMRLCLQIILA